MSAGAGAHGGVDATHEAYRSRRPRSHLPPRPKSAPLAALAALFSPKSQRLESHWNPWNPTCQHRKSASPGMFDLSLRWIWGFRLSGER